MKRLFTTAAFAMLASHAFAGELSAAYIARLPQDKVRRSRPTAPRNGTAIS